MVQKGQNNRLKNA